MESFFPCRYPLLNYMMYHSAFPVLFCAGSYGKISIKLSGITGDREKKILQSIAYLAIVRAEGTRVPYPAGKKGIIRMCLICRCKTHRIKKYLLLS